MTSLLTIFQWKKRWMAYCLANVILFSFLWTTLLNFNPVVEQFDNVEVRVVEIKKNYLVVQSQWTKYYLNLYDLKTSEKIFLNQYLKLSGLITKISFESKTYQFAFDKYLAAQNIHYQVEVKNFELLTKGLFYQISRFYDKVFVHDLTQIFFLSNRDSSFNLISALNNLSLSYLLNFSGLTIFLSAWCLNIILIKCHLKRKSRTVVKIVFDISFLLFSATLNFPFVLTKTFLFLLIKNCFWLKQVKLNRYNLWCFCFTILVLFNQQIIRSTSFLFYLVGLFFFDPAIFQGRKKNLLNFVIATISFGFITGLVDYRFYYFNELFSLLIAPLLACLNLFVYLTFYIPGINFVYDFLTKLLIAEFSFLTKINFFYSLGAVPFFWYFCSLSIFYLIIKKWTSSLSGWIMVFVFIIFVVIIFTYKLWNYPLGLHLLDVGNGSTTIYFDTNQVFVFDAGVGPGHSKETLSSFLKYFSIDQIDYLFISHPHQDHYNQVNSLTQNAIQIKHLVTKETAMSNYQFANLELKLFNLNQHHLNENNNSLVILLITQTKTILFMGDLETSSENELLMNNAFRQALWLNPIDYLIIGHHGSKTSSSLPFLEFVNPKKALISGENRGLNRFPNQEVLLQLMKLKIPYLITSSDGDLWIK